MKHTQGKWMIAKSGKFGWHISADLPSKQMIPGYGIKKQVETDICSLYFDDFCNAEETEANAELIAAAPETKQQRDELLEALRYIVRRSEFKGDQ